MSDIETKDRKECPFGIEARFCKYQETFANDILSAMGGELVLFCILDKMENCPQIKDLQND